MKEDGGKLLDEGGLEAEDVEENDVNSIYIVYWNSYAVAMCNARLRIPLPPHERRRLGGREA